MTGVRRGRRYPRGYGLPSLVVILFFVSVLVSAIAEAVARETVEARATAAFNGVRERLHAFEVTGGDGSALLPHLIPSRDVSVSLLPAGSGQPPSVLVEPGFRPGPEEVLFDQQLRAFLNIPAEVPIGTLEPGDLRRKHPERVLRSGDRMGAPIGMNGDPAAPASVLNVGETRSGTGNAQRSARAGLVEGLQTSLTDTPVLAGERVFSDALEMTGGGYANTGSVAGAVISTRVNALDVQITGLLRGRDAATPDTRVTGSFATDSLDEQDRIYFDQVNVAGLRSELVQANRLSFGTTFGPSPGQLQGVIPPVSPEQIFVGRQ